jgi:hypothetical protein
VKLFDGAGVETGGFYGHSASQATGVRVAAADVDGDLQPEVITASGPGISSLVVVHAPNGAVMGLFSPYGAFSGGVNVASGDVDGDTKAEIVTAADAGGGPHVIVWDFDNGFATPKMSWYAYGPGFKGGVNVAVADLTGSSREDVVTGAGPGGGPHVVLWDLGSGAPVATDSFYAYDAGFAGGVRVDGGELDGSRAIVTGAGPSGGPHVRVFSIHGVPKAGFFAYDPAFHGGVNVAVMTAQGGNLGHILTAPASGGGPHVRGWNADGAPLNISFYAYAPNMTNGVTLAAIPVLGTQNNTTQNGGGGSNSSSG